MPADHVPVTVLTGFLGSGKTTLLNHILTANHGKRIAVIENEFGEVGVDQDIVIRSEEEIFEMNNGCLCCTVRGDLIRILGNLMKRRDRFDYILIETTGLADPGPVAQTFFMDDELKAKTRIDGIITLVDAKHVSLHWDTHEVREQIAFADVLLLNKTDLVTPAELDELEKKIRRMNGMAKVVRTERSKVDMNQVLNVGGFSLERILEHEPDFLRDATKTVSLGMAEDHAHDDHCHDDHCDHPEHAHHDHTHDETIGSVGIVLGGAVNAKRLNAWLGKLLQEKGQDIFRMKGVLNLKGDEQRFVFQGVHMMFDGQPDRRWNPGEERVNKLVFIGRNLNRQELTDGLKGCLA
jgi:G3E family GTPase